MGEKNVDIMFLVAFVLIVSCVGISCADNEIIITSVPVAMNTWYPVGASGYLSTAVSPAITGSNWLPGSGPYLSDSNYLSSAVSPEIMDSNWLPGFGPYLSGSNYLSASAPPRIVGASW